MSRGAFWVHLGACWVAPRYLRVLVPPDALQGHSSMIFLPRFSSRTSSTWLLLQYVSSPDFSAVISLPLFPLHGSPSSFLFHDLPSIISPSLFIHHDFSSMISPPCSPLISTIPPRAPPWVHEARRYFDPKIVKKMTLELLEN